MKSTLFSAVSALALGAGAASAGNLDRTKTPIDLIFETGNYAELSFGYAMPDLSGTDNLGNPLTSVAKDFSIVGGGLKLQFTDRFSMSLIYDQPYGVDVSYNGNPAATLIGGTYAKAETDALTVLMRYNINDRISVYGGPRVVGAEGDIRLSGLGYGPLNGYRVSFDTDQALGYVVGAAYEIPDIAFRAALTYHSQVELDFNTVETFPGGVPAATGTTTSKLPQTVKLQVQSGIAQNTLLFGSVRWSDHSVFTLNPPSPAPNLASLEDAWTYEIGVGRRFTEKLSGSLTYAYEDEAGSNAVSPLSPAHGRQSIAIGGKYQLTEKVSLSGGVKYIWLGDARVAPGGVPRGSVTDNNAVTIGMKVGYSF